MNPQKTISGNASIEGVGLFGGNTCTVRFRPAPEDTGIVFVRTDSLSPIEIPVCPDYISERPHRTSSLSKDGVNIETVEHILSAVYGLGLDNLYIEMNGDEVPSIDGSSNPFVKVLEEAGFEEQDIDKDVYVIENPVVVSGDGCMLAVLPGPRDHLEILYELEYDSPGIGRQMMGFSLGKDNYASQIAPARTFLLESEVQQFRAMGLGTHLTHADVLVMGQEGPIDNELRFRDEHVRHKIMDLIGDMALLGRYIHGKILATRSGHGLNHSLVRKLHEVIARGQSGAVGEPVMDIRKILRKLPHRYPFLMIDRVISIDKKKAVGIKNVTINEPYFTGHYPHLPLMPGVLIVEAMAQLSGLLFSSQLEHTGKTAVLLSMDRVKLRRPVRPGDQLVLEAHALHARTRTGHSRCIARVGDVVAAEAEIKFMLVDSEAS